MCVDESVGGCVDVTGVDVNLVVCQGGCVCVCSSPAAEGSDGAVQCVGVDVHGHSVG